MDKFINNLLSNPFKRFLSVLVLVLLVIGIMSFTYVNAQSYIDQSLAYIDTPARFYHGVRIDGGANHGLIVVDGNVGFKTSDPAIDLAIGDSDTGLEQISDGMLAIFTNNTERVRIENGGFVGIGNTNPDDRLDVNGTMDATTVETDSICLGALPCITSWPQLGCPPRSIWVRETNSANEDERLSYTNCTRNSGFVDLSNPHLRNAANEQLDVVGVRGDNDQDDCEFFCYAMGFNSGYCTNLSGATSCQYYVSSIDYGNWLGSYDSSSWSGCRECESCRCIY